MLPEFNIHTAGYGHFKVPHLKHTNGWEEQLGGDGDCQQVFVYSDTNTSEQPTAQLALIGHDDAPWIAVMVLLNGAPGTPPLTSTFNMTEAGLQGAMADLERQADAVRQAAKQPAMAL